MNFWNRLQGLPKERLAYKAFKVALELDDKSSFIRNVKTTFKEINKVSYWDTQQQIPKAILKTEIKQAINVLYDSLWRNILSEADKENRGLIKHLRQN